LVPALVRPQGQRMIRHLRPKNSDDIDRVHDSELAS
jgi:hypothetical protein